MAQLFHDIYRDRRVLVTGHTGFKGSWLVEWLTHLGAQVLGFSLEPPTRPNHFELISPDCESMIADIRDADVVYGALKNFEPEIVFHLAAQPLVRASYADPVETFETNVMGSLNVFEACRKTPSVRVILNITSDKCYENQERDHAYQEGDPMGGWDPYSCSKGCAELLSSSYRRSYFPLERYGQDHQILLATCRAGNVIGGGDWAQDRLVPDVMRAAASGATVHLRNPQATRPWQHVLEPLSGYLVLAQRLWEGAPEFACGWNFGPDPDKTLRVQDVVEQLAAVWDKVVWGVDDARHPHEAGLLKLNSDAARSQLGWSDVWSAATTIRRTVDWYRRYYDEGIIRTDDDLTQYMADAAAKGLQWIR